MQPQLEQIESKIAFLEAANAQLSDVVYGQQQQLDALRAQLAEFTSRFAAGQSTPDTYTVEEEKPPHY